MQYKTALEKRAGEIGWVINNSAADCPVVLKFDALLHCGTPDAAELLKYSLKKQETSLSIFLTRIGCEVYFDIKMFK